MRRFLMRFLPVFLLALTLQILAPVGACFAAASAASDPLAGMVLCHGAGDSHEADPAAPHLRDGSCALCAAVAPFTPASPQPSLASVARHTYRVTWHAFAPQARAAKIASNAQARGPPTIS